MSVPKFKDWELRIWWIEVFEDCWNSFLLFCQTLCQLLSGLERGGGRGAIDGFEARIGSI